MTRVPHDLAAEVAALRQAVEAGTLVHQEDVARIARAEAELVIERSRLADAADCTNRAEAEVAALRARAEKAEAEVKRLDILNHEMIAELETRSVPCSKCGAETGSLGRRLTSEIGMRQATQRERDAIRDALAAIMGMVYIDDYGDEALYGDSTVLDTADKALNGGEK